MKQIYICSDTITGLCSALHDAWLENRDGDAGIGVKGKTQQQLFCQYKTVDETDKKAGRLQRMVKRYLGYIAYRDIFYALLIRRKGRKFFEHFRRQEILQTAGRLWTILEIPMSQKFSP